MCDKCKIKNQSVFKSNILMILLNLVYTYQIKGGGYQTVPKK